MPPAGRFLEKSSAKTFNILGSNCREVTLKFDKVKFQPTEIFPLKQY